MAKLTDGSQYRVVEIGSGALENNWYRGASWDRALQGFNRLVLFSVHAKERGKCLTFWNFDTKTNIPVSRLELRHVKADETYTVEEHQDI